MPRFEVGNRVDILPRYANLYREQFGIVVGVRADPFRPVFDEYTIEFSDRTSAGVFDFQLSESQKLDAT